MLGGNASAVWIDDVEIIEKPNLRSQKSLAVGQGVLDFIESVLGSLILRVNF
jgi:hypothetical protein